VKKASLAKKKKGSPARTKSAYELLRDSKVARNQKRLFDLGLDKSISESPLKKTDCNRKSTTRKERHRSKQNNVLSSPASVSDNEEEDSFSSDSSVVVNTVDEEGPEEIEKILDYKVTVKGREKLRIQWSTGAKEWADYDNVQEDCADLVADFMKHHENEDTSRQEIHVSINTNDAALKECKHQNFEIGVTYMPEEQTSYLQPNNELHGVQCALCEDKFVHTEPVSEKETKPSAKKPMYTCSNRATVKKCLHCICFKCMMVEIKKKGGGKSLRPRSEKTKKYE
jgi:hypothetical protein